MFSKIIPYTSIDYLVIGNNKISDISALYDVLPKTKIKRLKLLTVLKI